jgi:hypothetical protein
MEAKTGTDTSERSAAGGDARRVCPCFRGLNASAPTFQPSPFISYADYHSPRLSRRWRGEGRDEGTLSSSGNEPKVYTRIAQKLQSNIFRSLNRETFGCPVSGWRSTKPLHEYNPWSLCRTCRRTDHVSNASTSPVPLSCIFDFYRSEGRRRYCPGPRRPAVRSLHRNGN